MKLSFSLAFNALMLLQVCSVVFAHVRFSNETDMQALLEFKSHLSENKREVLASWNHSSSFCNWIGVTCGRKEGRVISLDLGGFKLAGAISPSIEYGMGGPPSIQGDVYSFGVLLLEMFTGKKPTDNSFAGDYNLHSYTKSVLSGGTSSGGSNTIDEWLRLVFQVGIRCCEEYPRNRMKMAEAVHDLISIRSKFFSSEMTIADPSPRDVLHSSPQEWILNADMHTI